MPIVPPAVPTDEEDCDTAAAGGSAPAAVGSAVAAAGGSAPGQALLRRRQDAGQGQGWSVREAAGNVLQLCGTKHK